MFTAKDAERAVEVYNSTRQLEQIIKALSEKGVSSFDFTPPKSPEARSMCLEWLKRGEYICETHDECFAKDAWRISWGGNGPHEKE